MNIEENAIVFDKVNYTQSNQKILKNIDLTINYGEFVGIVGPNGGGKTTLIKLLLGIINPTSGKINKKKNIIIGYVPQRLSNSVFDFPTTVKELLENTIISTNISIAEVVCKCNIGSVINSQLKNLSGGERQRVFVARSLLLQPNFLILDEPTTGIDKANKESFWGLISDLNSKNNIGVVLISHDSFELTNYAKRIIWVDGVIQKDSSSNLFGNFHFH